MKETGEKAGGTEIRIRGLKKAFGEHVVLRGIDLEIGRGEMVAIIGGSGCGKTVLLNHILGMLPPDSGEVLVADHTKPGAPLVEPALIDDSALDALHTHWGVVFQRNALYSGTVYDNIRLELAEVKNMEDEEIIPIAQRVLKAVALPDDESFFKTETDSLSGGMAKRLAVARALSLDPAVLFYDEPTTGLDPTSAAQIHDLILATHNAHGAGQSQRTARTTLFITHDKDLLARLEPRTVMIHEGGIVFDGPFEAFEASKDPLIRPYFELMPMLHKRDPGSLEAAQART